MSPEVREKVFRLLSELAKALAMNAELLEAENKRLKKDA